MLPIHALSIRTCATMFPPSSATAMFIGWPISLAFFSAALITRRASSNFTAVMGSPFMCYAATPDRANFALVNKVTGKGAALRLSAPGFRCSLLLASECGVRCFSERHDCVEEGLALAQEQTGIYQARRGRNRSRGIGVAGPDDRTDGQVFVQKNAGFRHNVAAVRVLPNVGKARAVVAFVFADSFKVSLEDGEVVDLHGADGGEDCHDVEVRDFSHKRVVEAASTLLDCSKVKGGGLCNRTELIAANRLGYRNCGLVDDVGYLGEGFSEVGVSGLTGTLGKVRKGSRLIGVLPAATRNALMKVAWLRSSSNTPQM